jgi:hypothetical protein
MYITILVTLSAFTATMWARSAQKQHRRGEFTFVDWGFAAHGNITIAGWYHIVYYGLQVGALITGAVVIFLSKTTWNERIVLIVSILAYAATAAYDMRKIGLSAGPIAGPRQFK